MARRLALDAAACVALALLWAIFPIVGASLALLALFCLCACRTVA
jgi:hypothetical protein